MFHLVQEFLCHYQTIISNLFCKKLTVTLLVCLVAKVLIQGQLHGGKCNTYFLYQSLHFLACIFHHFLLQLVVKFWCMEAIRTSAVLIVSVADLLLFSWSLKSIEQLLWLWHFDAWHKSSWCRLLLSNFQVASTCSCQLTLTHLTL